MTGPVWAEIVPVWLTAVWAGLLGLAIGSFLNVVVYRVPAGMSVVHPPSACPGCGHAIRNRDNVPVLGWLLLRGRCRDCAEPIAARYPLVEAATGVVFAAVAVRVPHDPTTLAALLVVSAACIAHTLIDLEHGRLPFSITRTTALLAAVPVGAASVIGGSFPTGAVIGAVLWLGVYGLIWVATFGAGMGLGDVALAPLLGAALGLLGVSSAAAGLAAGFALGGVYGAAVLARRRIRGGTAAGPVLDPLEAPASGLVDVGSVTVTTNATRGTTVPFGPFMVAGTAVGLFAGQPLAEAYLRLVGLA